MIYEDAQLVLGNAMELGTFIDLDATTSADNPVPAKDRSVVLRSTINSLVVSIAADPLPPTPFEECMTVIIEHLEENTGQSHYLLAQQIMYEIPQPCSNSLFVIAGNKREPYCAYWDYSLDSWSGTGCEVADTNETHTKCCCYHMTNFAIMMEPLIIEPIDHTARILQMITFVTVGLSLFSLLVFILVIICNKSLRSERSMVHLNLCISTIVALISYLLVEFAREDEVCRLYYLHPVFYKKILCNVILCNGSFISCCRSTARCLLSLSTIFSSSPMPGCLWRLSAYSTLFSMDSLLERCHAMRPLPGVSGINTHPKTDC